MKALALIPVRRFATTPVRRFATTAVAAALALAGCQETPQDAAKTYAGKEDTKAYAGDLFKGDKDKYEKTLSKRAEFQNEYIRTGDAKVK